MADKFAAERKRTARKAALADKQLKEDLGTAVKLLSGLLPRIKSYTTLQAQRYRLVRLALDALAGERATMK